MHDEGFYSKGSVFYSKFHNHDWNATTARLQTTITFQYTSIMMWLILFGVLIVLLTHYFTNSNSTPRHFNTRVNHRQLNENWLWPRGVNFHGLLSTFNYWKSNAHSFMRISYCSIAITQLTSDERLTISTWSYTIVW